MIVDHAGEFIQGRGLIDLRCRLNHQTRALRLASSRRLLLSRVCQRGFFLGTLGEVGSGGFYQQRRRGQLQAVLAFLWGLLGRDLEQGFKGFYHRVLISCSSFTWSVTKLRMPSASFSVAMASSFSS